MTTLNGGRNEIRFNNSGGKCLLENWVEERAVGDLDPQDLNADVASSAQVFKDGHTALLTQSFQQPMNTITTIQDSYRPPPGPQVRLKGAKQELLEQLFYDQMSKDVHEEFNKPPPSPEYESVTQGDFNRLDFVPTKPAPTAPHDLVREQPVTFWTEHKDKIHSVSQIKTLETQWRKNTAFSQPIDEYWDQPQPYEQEQVPKM